LPVIFLFVNLRYPVVLRWRFGCILRRRVFDPSAPWRRRREKWRPKMTGKREQQKVRQRVATERGSGVGTDKRTNDRD
jgi:hypothetical protein